MNTTKLDFVLYFTHLDIYGRIERRIRIQRDESEREREKKMKGYE